jgi:aldose 1-epimerase
MAYTVRSEARPIAANFDGTIYVLEESSGAIRAEIWPALGFNCYRWNVASDGQALELLYSDPQFFETAKPTRSGIPILFPFPGRIRDGCFRWAGKSYQLPINDSKGNNAIHGFACRKPWRATAQGADHEAAWLTGEFWGSKDAPETLAVWPGDYRIRITYRLSARALRMEAAADNPGRTPLPFGLGYHPYFRVPMASGMSADHFFVEARASNYWEVENLLPDGKRPPVDGLRDLRRPRQFSELNLDDLLTGLEPAIIPGTGGLYLRGCLQQNPGFRALGILTDASFRELVVFTPPHRQAVCIEPYTSTGDAINLHERGIDAGLLVLEPGATWNGVVELRLD